MLTRPGITVFTGIAALVFALPVLGTGCGSDSAEFDKAANYTPESLAQELVLRYRALNPSAKTSSRAASNDRSKSALAARKNPEKKVITKTTKNRSAPTIDDVLDDIKYKISLIPNEAPTEVIKKMIATVSSDNSLSDGEKKSLTELIEHMAD
jgi:hypothetical protein